MWQRRPPDNYTDQPLATSCFVVSSFVNLDVSKAIWHKRLGHPSIKVVDQIIKLCKLPVDSHEPLLFYESCQFGKSHALSHALSRSHATTPFAIVNTDL